MTVRRRATAPVATPASPKKLEGRINVTRGFKQGGILVNESDEQETFSVRKFDSEPAYVTVKAGLTKELGSYEFLRIDISASIPCYVEEMNDAFDFLGEKVAHRLDQEVSAYLEGIEDGKA